MVKSAPVRSIIDAIDAAASAWSERGFAKRASAAEAVSARTGYSLPVVGLAFDRLFASLRGGTLAAIIADELGSLDALDRFVERPGRPPARALPIGPVCIISSRTTIGVALIPALFALCAKCDVVVKDREDRLVGAFFQTLAERLGEPRPAIEARAWEGESADLSSFALVVVFGSDRTLRKVSEGLRFPARLIAYPAKASAGYLSRESLRSTEIAETIAAGAAMDMLLYDGEGCLSLHALFVQRGATVSGQEFCRILERAIENAARAFPATPSAESSNRLAMARDVALLRNSGGGRVFSNMQSPYLVIFDPPTDEPPLFLPRALSVYSVDGADEMTAYLAQNRLSLEALAVAESGAPFAAIAAGAGASRITSFGSLQMPPLGGFHGGRPRIAEFVRWIVDET